MRLAPRSERRRSCWLLLLLTGILAWTEPRADPASDIRQLRAAYAARFPGVPWDDYVLGIYAFDPALRAQWAEINEFPPYEFAIDEGRQVFETPLPDGSRLAACLPGGGVGTLHTWPRIEPASGEVETLALALNRCRVRAGAPPWAYDRGPLVMVLTYLASTSRGQRQAVMAPFTAPAAAAFERGRVVFERKRGQRNFSCADCHVTAAGHHLREQPLAPLLGAFNHYPVYGLGWGGMGTLQARFSGCFELSGAAPLPLESPEYRDLEYFMATLARGLPWVGPGLHR